MQPKISLIWSWFIVVITGIMFYLLIVFGIYSPQNTPKVKSAESINSLEFLENIASLDQISSGLPIRLIIPKIFIKANVEYVGLTPSGAMDVPKGPAEVAWYSLGTRPGEKGNAVIAGHSGWRNNIPAVFDNLHKLRKGDKIYIEGEKGEILTFIVRESKTYKPKANAYDVFISNDGLAHLNLITCTGFWNKIAKTHSDRLVVFADRE